MIELVKQNEHTHKHDPGILVALKFVNDGFQNFEKITSSFDFDASHMLSDHIGHWSLLIVMILLQQSLLHTLNSIYKHNTNFIVQEHQIDKIQLRPNQMTKRWKSFDCFFRPTVFC